MIHDLRSALEHVAWVLAASNTDHPERLWEAGVRERITFPVAKKPEHFDTHSLMPLISEPAMAALDPLQPHTRGHPAQVARHPLVALHELWNIDKHRVVHGGIGQIDLSTTTWVPKAIDIDELAGGIDVEPVEIKGPLEDGAPIAYIRFRAIVEPPGSTKVDMEGQPTARVLFGAGERAASGQGLEALCAYVAMVLTAVRPVLPPR